MAITSAGEIKFSDLRTELNQSGELSIAVAAEGGYESINSNSSSTPNADAPHAISEWYGYDHSAAPPAQYYWDLSNDIKSNGSNGKQITCCRKHTRTIEDKSDYKCSNTDIVLNK